MENNHRYLEERLFTPPEAITLASSQPLVFLGGPVQGAPDWQRRFAATLIEETMLTYVASPRRTLGRQALFDEQAQKIWEHTTLERAKRCGVLTVWWAAQDLSDPTYPAGRAYAQTSRIEFGKFTGWKDSQPHLPIVVGFDSTYSANGGGSERYVRFEAQQYGIPVYDDPDAFVAAIIAEAAWLEQTGSSGPH